MGWISGYSNGSVDWMRMCPVDFGKSSVVAMDTDARGTSVSTLAQKLLAS